MNHVEEYSRALGMDEEDTLLAEMISYAAKQLSQPARPATLVVPPWAYQVLKKSVAEASLTWVKQYG